MYVYKPDIVIYHGGCPDGIASAVTFHQRFTDLEMTAFHPAFHKSHTKLPECINKVVYLLDFCYPQEEMKHILDRAKHVVVIDHHKSSLWLLQNKFPNLETVIDMEYSGAQLTWQYCFPAERVPWYIDDIADRDLWRFTIPGSKEVGAAMFSLGYYTSMNAFASHINKRSRPELFKMGQILQSQTDDFIRRCVSRAIDCNMTLILGGKPVTYKVRLVHKPFMNHSEVGNALVADRKCHFAIMYQLGLAEGEWWFSVRAHPDSDVDLPAILTALDKNAGGHVKAAGFTLRIQDIPDLRTLFVPLSDQEKHSLSDTII